VLALKHHFGLQRDRLVDVERVRGVVGTDANGAVADLIAERAIVLARDSASLVPLLRNKRRPKVLSVTYARRSDLSAGTTFNSELRGRVGELRTAFVSADDAAPDFSLLLADARRSDIVLVGSHVNITSETATAGAPRAFVDFVAALRAAGAEVIVVSFGSPYLLLQVPTVGSYVIAWVGLWRRAARALLGTQPITARLPISLPPFLLPAGSSARSSGDLRPVAALTRKWARLQWREVALSGAV
jgi:hypothetical protein